MAPELVPEPKFRPLHEVLAEVYSEHPTIRCASYKADGELCQNTIKSTEKLDAAQHWVEKISQTLKIEINRHPSLPGFLSQLCNYCFCIHHKTHKGNPSSQWRDELETKISKPESLRQQFISLLEMNERWPPHPRKLEFEAILLGKIFDSNDKTIDKLLEKKLNGTDKHYLYVLSSEEAVGKFKIGVCKDHPKDVRIDQHDKCYPKSVIECIPISKYAYRVEQLILAEFKEYHFQLKEGCWVCFKEEKKVRHKEWLNVDKSILLGRIHEWQKFFIDRPHGKKPYDKDGRFNPEAGPHSPHRTSPERPTAAIHMKNSGWSSSRSPTPCNGSPNPYSTTVGGMGTISRNSLERSADSTSTTSGRGSSSSSSRSSLSLNDSPIPFSITGGDTGKISGKSPEISASSTHTMSSRRSLSSRTSLPSKDHPVSPSRTDGDMERAREKSPEISEYSTPIKIGHCSRHKTGMSAGDKSGNSTESDTILNSPMRKLAIESPIGSSERRTSLRLQKNAVQ